MTESNKPNDNECKARRINRLESTKLAYDHLKHIATLDTGSILILTTFLDKLFVNPQWKILVAISLGGFIFSILGALIAQSHVITGQEPYGSMDKTVDAKILVGTYAVAYLGFIAGITCLAVFAIRNFIAC